MKDAKEQIEALLPWVKLKDPETKKVYYWNTENTEDVEIQLTKPKIKKKVISVADAAKKLQPPLAPKPAAVAKTATGSSSIPKPNPLFLHDVTVPTNIASSSSSVNATSAAVAPTPVKLMIGGPAPTAVVRPPIVLATKPSELLRNKDKPGSAKKIVMKLKSAGKKKMSLGIFR